MRRVIAPIVLVFLAGIATASLAKASTPSDDALEADSAISADRLEHIVRTLASDAFEGRATGHRWRRQNRGFSH